MLYGNTLNLSQVLKNGDLYREKRAFTDKGN